MMLRETQKRTVLLTGVTGNVGSKIAATILSDTGDTRLILLLRAGSEREAFGRVERSLRTVDPDIDLRQVRCRTQIICGDIILPHLGIPDHLLPKLRAGVTHVIHAAASTKFTSPLEDSLKVNYRGTERVLELALDLYQRGRLQALGHVSTAYLCGNRDGVFKESEFPQSPRFANSYEQSKWLAEGLIRHNRGRLPVAIFRPSIVVGDSGTGRIVSFNVMYTPIRLIWSGVVRRLPAMPSTPLDIVSVDYVADTIWRILSRRSDFAGKTYHLAAGAGERLTVGEIVARAIACFKAHFPEHRQPLVDFAPSAARTASGSVGGGRGTRPQQLLTQFAPYLGTSPIFACDNTIAALEGSGIRLPSIADYLDRVLAYCLSATYSKSRSRAA